MLTRSRSSRSSMRSRLSRPVSTPARIKTAGSGRFPSRGSRTKYSSSFPRLLVNRNSYFLERGVSAIGVGCACGARPRSRLAPHPAQRAARSCTASQRVTRPDMLSPCSFHHRISRQPDRLLAERRTLTRRHLQEPRPALHAQQIFEIDVLGPERRVIGPGSSEHDAVCHREAMFSAEFGGLQRDRRVEINNHPLPHYCNRLESVPLTALL